MRAVRHAGGEHAVKHLLFVLAALIMALSALPARAQNVGSITGHVYDATGVPLQGVKVTATSDTQIGGPRNVYTDEEGFFRLVGLNPGRFTLRTDAPKLKTVVQENVRVTLGGTTDVDLILEVETEIEEVKVVERAPVVNVNRTAVGESFDADFLNELPLTSRDYQGAALLTPGVVDTSRTGNPNVRGGTFFNNNYQVDGFDTTDPVTHTFGQNFSFNAISALEVQTAGHGAENAAVAGGIINLNTKSGSNRFEFEVTADYEDQNMQFFRDARDLNRRQRFVQTSVNFGGPIVKDRIWYYVSIQGTNGVSQLPRDPVFNDHPPFSVLGLDGFAKVTWQLTPRNKLEIKGAISPAEFRNRLQSYLVEAEAEARSLQRSEFIGLQWHSLLRDNLFFVTRAGYQQVSFDQGPMLCLDDPDACAHTAGEVDVLTGIRRRNFTRQTRDHRKTFQLSGHIEYFKDTKRFGYHDVKLGWKFMSMTNPWATAVPGDAVFYNRGTEPFAREEICANDPKLSNGECRSGWLRSNVQGSTTSVFLQDAWKPTRYVMITPGVAVHTGSSENDRGTAVTEIFALTPHLSASWDATHDGKTVLRASFNGYADTGFLALARFTARGLYEKQCFWDADAKAYVGNCRAQGGNTGVTVGLPCGPDGTNPDGTSCRTPLRAPRVWEYTIGGEREVVTGIGLGVDVIYRRFINQWEDAETNANWNRGGTDLLRGANFKTGRSEFVFDLQTPDASHRRYRAVQLYAHKREGRAKFRLSYNWQRYEGTADEDFVTMFLDNPGQARYYYGPLMGDYRHDIRAQTTFQLRRWVSVGASYQFMSGGPYNRYFFDPIYGSFSALGTRRGYDSQGTINPDDDVPLRLPDLSMLNLQVRVNLKSVINQSVEIFGDLFNLLALRTPTGVIETDGPFFGRPAGRQLPTRLRMGMRYRW
jgi:hypothetical protein